MPVRKTQKGANLRRWFKEKWTDEKGNPCGSRKNRGVKKCRPSKRISGKTVKTWGEMSSSEKRKACLLYTSPSPRDRTRSRMPSSA